MSKFPNAFLNFIGKLAPFFREKRAGELLKIIKSKDLT
jgi:hypothetical protein